MARYKYTGNNDFYLNAGETVLSPGDEVELDEVPGEFGEKFEKVENAAQSDSDSEEDDSPSEDEESEESGNEAAQNEVEAPFDPSDFNVDQLAAEIEGQDLTEEQLQALFEAEEDGEGRTTALDTIEDKIAERE